MLLLGGIFDYDVKKERLEEILLQLEQPDVWNDPDQAQALGRERASLEEVVDNVEKVAEGVVDNTELLELVAEEQDEELLSSVQSDIEVLDKMLAKLEFKRMFSGEADANNAFFDIQAGSGGTEAQDWANMILRMYDSVEVDINPADLRVDTYRASGAGGQHVNKTESAIRITHIPTNTVVQCQNDRSQHKNRAEAMKMLKARLYEREMQERRSEAQAAEDQKSDIGWGSQIRSYVLDQSRIKDLRTSHETGNTQGVLDGDLDPFIEASLKAGL